MGELRATRIQLCGRLVVELDGRRVEEALPGAKGRLLFAYLVLNRDRRMSRDELLRAAYGEESSPDRHPSLSVLLSKLRGVIGPELLAGRSAGRASSSAAATPETTSFLIGSSLRKAVPGGCAARGAVPVRARSGVRRAQSTR